MALRQFKATNDNPFYIYSFCVGLFCDVFQVVTENYECVKDHDNFEILVFRNATYVYIKPDQDSDKETESEKYIKTMRSNPSILNRKRTYNILYYLKYIVMYYQKILYIGEEILFQ